MNVMQMSGLADLSSYPTTIPGISFGEAAAAAQLLDPGMGVAVARRTVFRPEDAECFGRVADRVATGNMSLLKPPLTGAERTERARLRNAIASGALITSGRHLQHGDADQAGRNMELFTNCATAITSFAKFYLLLNGSGVGRSYDDELVVVDWADAPDILLHLDPTHPDFPADRPELNVTAIPPAAIIHRVDDSREGWGKALELIEGLAFAKRHDAVVLLDFSAVRREGAPIAGMQGRPASGPISLIRGFINLRDNVIAPSRLRDRAGLALQPWEQALLVDHFFSMEVQVGGARRAARMATKSWRDPGIFRFIRAKSEGGLWTANNSVVVDREFWALVGEGCSDSVLAAQAIAVFNDATECGYKNGEPGFINGDMLDDHRTGRAWDKPVFADGRDFRSNRYQADFGADLLAALAQCAQSARFPAITNPCGEIVLHATGGYCVIADFAPLLACPIPPENIVPGFASDAVIADWDARVEDSVRLGVRFLMRANRMNALYGEEVRRTNRIGIGPTGLHEWAWMRFGLGFDDLLDETAAAPFYCMLEALSDAAKDEADRYACELGMIAPFTVTTVKPAGTTSKLFGLTEGAHLPARKQYLRWVQFRGTRDAAGNWSADSDPLLAQYAARGYQVRGLTSFPGMAIVGFPTLPRIQRLGIGDRAVTASDATPAQQFAWLRLLERHWIGAERGNQVSYTLKFDTSRHSLAEFRAIVLENQPTIRCCAILPGNPDDLMGYEYLPEEDMTLDAFIAMVNSIEDPGLHEAVDTAHLQCASGACPM
ncbi:MAG: recombinase [Acetobacteraceae bacterium]|nr:recombinase [Acetobacteraceae bacterium]